LTGIIKAMPIFEYRCKKCDHEFEKIVFNTTAEIVCPKCSGKEAEKLLSGFAVQGGTSSSSKALPAPAGCGSGGFR
jgi:putative FmdB family regulatory protein